jgi:hypothetical protein
MMGNPEYETATVGRRPAHVRAKVRSLMTPEERAAARERRLAELEAQIEDEREPRGPGSSWPRGAA